MSGIHNLAPTKVVGKMEDDTQVILAVCPHGVVFEGSIMMNVATGEPIAAYSSYEKYWEIMSGADQKYFRDFFSWIYVQHVDDEMELER